MTEKEEKVAMQLASDTIITVKFGLNHQIVDAKSAIIEDMQALIRLVDQKNEEIKNLQLEGR